MAIAVLTAFFFFFSWGFYFSTGFFGYGKRLCLMSR